MTNMKALTFWKTLGIGGLIINAVVITMLLTRPSHPPMHKGDLKIREKISEILKFNSTQKDEYDKLIINDRGYLKEIRQKRKVFFESAMLEEDSLKREIWLDSLSAVIYKMEKGRIQHIYNIKNICDPTQKKLFENNKEYIYRLFQSRTGRINRPDKLKERPLHGPPHYRDDNEDLPPPPPMD